MKKLQQSVFVVALLLAAFEAIWSKPMTPLCQSRCGNITLVYPFVVVPKGCFKPVSKDFSLVCKDQKLWFKDSKVMEISLSGEMRVAYERSYACDGKEKEFLEHRFDIGEFSVSGKNKLMAVGCGTVAFVATGFYQNSSSTGCMTGCGSNTTLANGMCGGGACCEVSVARGFKTFTVILDRLSRGREKPSPCGYAFLVEEGQFNFSTEDVKETHFPVVLDWSIGNQSCEQVGSRKICGSNTDCLNSVRGIGYICKCIDGYSGNPYLPDDKNVCQDINECATRTHNCSLRSTCENTRGSFRCTCPDRHVLNVTDNTCNRKQTSQKEEWTQIILGIVIALLLITLAVTCIRRRIKQRKEMQLRESLFMKNGGGLLMEKLSEESNLDVKIFSKETIQEATLNFDESRIIGRGGQGVVYRGVLPDNSEVAIKRACFGDDTQKAEFVNELLVLAQINHRNVVKVRGCCLETEQPLLVYEFVNNKTLFHHLHAAANYILTWDDRIKIGIQLAQTLSYLHSYASVPIIHRDIKSANILLDESLTPKIADFGASKLLPVGKELVDTAVLGTLGYLDPEYHNTRLLSAKSDVFGYGVVLMELISGKNVVTESKHLVSYFSSAIRESKLCDVVDARILYEAHQIEIEKAAKIALECTKPTGVERPHMKEVFTRLQALIPDEK